MIQPVQLQRAKFPVLAAGALGLVALAAFTSPRFSAPAPEVIVIQAPSSLAQRALVGDARSDGSTCGAGAYVPGDVAGDASPAAVYAAMCEGR
jgi:hypothetical protein